MFWETDSEHPQRIYDEDELCEVITDTIKYYRQINERLAAENIALRKDAIKEVRADYEDEIEHLNQRLSMSYGEFSSQKEKDAYNDFEQRHMHERLTMRIQSGKAPYLIPTGTGIGTVLKVVCPICGKSEDITDVEVW